MEAAKRVAAEEKSWTEQTGEIADAMPTIEERFLAFGGVVNGGHNGYGFETLWLRGTDDRMLGMLNPGTGEYHVKAGKTSDVGEWEEHNSEAFAALLEMLDEGLGDDGCLSLYENDPKVPEIVDIFTSAGLPAPFLLNEETGEIKGRA